MFFFFVVVVFFLCIIKWFCSLKGVKVFHSIIAVGAVAVRVPLYLGHS